MKKKYKLAGSLMAGVMLVSMLTTGCAKDVECEVVGEHVHLYNSPSSGLSKYVESEKEYIGDFLRNDDYLKMTEELKLISDNNLYSISDNQEYFINAAKNKNPNKREEHVYGSYFGFGYSYNFSEGEYQYYYGYHLGYHWQEISFDEYTNNKIKDTIYAIKVYKIENGNVTSAEFDTLEDIPNDYKYFSNDIIVKYVDEYHLEQENIKSR